MIDIHSHILPGIDDGAESLEEAIAMARIAAADGVKTIIATPHDSEWGSGCSLAETQKRVNELAAQVSASGINISLAAGLEAYISPNLPRKLEIGEAFTLSGSRYLLIEFPFQQVPLYTEQVLFELQAAGITPIIAHPERNAAIQNDHSLLERLVERGMLAQVTAASILGTFGTRVRETSHEFLRRNLVHVIASDAHSSTSHRSPVLSEAVTVAGKIIGPERAYVMVNDIPGAIVSGLEVRVDPPNKAKAKKIWAFWR